MSGLWRIYLDNFRAEIIPEPPKKETRSGCLSFTIDTIETILLALILFFGINAISARVRVENVSMKPTLQPGEFVLVNKIAYKIGKPQIGDIIVFHYPRDPKEDYIKRLIGRPGDEVTVKDGKVYVNDQPLNEPYIAAAPAYDGSWTVPADSVFVLGDNRNQSSDSHSWGFVPLDFVVGKALFIYWPLQQFQVIEHPATVIAAR
jgi:signal peptidase I